MFGDIRKKRYWENGCSHKEDEYIGSTSLPVFSDRFIEKIDVYIWGEKQEVCIRFGERPENYYSLLSLKQLYVGSHDSELYRKAIEVIEHFGKIKFIRN